MGNVGQAGFTVVAEDRDGVAVLSPIGDLDLASAAEFRRSLANAMSRLDPPLIIADLQAVDFCDSSGLNALIWSANTVEAAGGRLVLSGITPRVARLLQITGLGKRFRAGDEVNDAAALLPGPAGVRD
jgi:anti-sigma B factor antagonist